MFNRNKQLMKSSPLRKFREIVALETRAQKSFKNQIFFREIVALQTRAKKVSKTTDFFREIIASETRKQKRTGKIRNEYNPRRS